MVYGATIVAVLAAVLMRWLLDPVLVDQLPLVTLYGAVAAALWWGGYRPALVAVATGYLACNYLFMEPRYRVAVNTAPHLVGLITFLFTCSIIVALGEAMRRAQRHAEEERRRVRVTLTSIGDAVITTDAEGRITLLNRVAETLTGWTNEEAAGQPLPAVFRIVEEKTMRTVEDPVSRVMASGSIVGLGNHTVLIARDGTELPIDDSAAPIRDARGQIAGVVLVFRDASESRSIETALRQQVSLFEESREAVFGWRFRGPIIFWNRGAERLYGYTKQEAIGRVPDILLATVFPQGSRSAFEADFERSGEFTGELVHTGKDGRPITVESHIQLMNEGGERPFALQTSRDVTERKQVEKALVENERRFRHMADAAPVMIWVSGTDKLCTWFNKPWLDFVGRPLEKELGNGWAENVHSDDFDRCLATYTSAFDARQPFSMEYRLRRHDGEYRWLLDNGVPLHGGAAVFTGYIGSCLDITERKEAEERLREAEERARTVVENVVDGIITIDSVGTIQSFNPAAEGLFGYEAREVIGRNVRTLMPEPHRSAHDGYIANYLTTGRAKIIGSGREVEGLRKDGSAFPMDLAVSEFRLHERRYFTGIVRDITERRLLEQRLRERAEQLAVVERRKDEFLATLAHELRNPLAPIHNAVQVLMMTGLRDPELKWSREVIDRHVRHMARLLDDLLDVSRITHGKLALRKERIRLAAVIQSAIETSRPLVESQRHELVVVVPDEPILIDADPVRLAQVFSNLINNAARYTEPGGHIRLIAERQGSDVVVTVKDDGIGIPAEMMPRIFEMFCQGQERTERASGGLGVGLSLVQGLVQLHGGHVEALSGGQDMGSEFIVRLPAAVEARPPAPPSHEVSEVVPPRRLLIVDDMQDTADSLAYLMRLKGHEVRTAYDGVAAIAAAAEFRPEIVLLDIGMPKLDGYETCRQIRRQPWGKDMFLVALTGWGQDGDRRRADEAGFDRHLVKPVDPGALMTLLAALPPGPVRGRG